MEINKHKVEEVMAIIAKNRGKEDFPKHEDFGFTEEEFDNVIYSASNVGTIESLKKQYTIYGIAIILPMALSSFFFSPNKSLFIGLPIGALLAGIVYLLYRFKDKKREKEHGKMNIEGFINAVLNYKSI